MIKKLSESELRRIIGGNSANPGSYGLIIRTPKPHFPVGDKYSKAFGEKINRCISLGLGLSRGPVGCEP